jgi:GH15 family glucan-1,4-alpha-glucosidase
MEVRGMHQPAISDHAAIGNLRTVALVAADGGINWWCPPSFDSPSVFASILDSQRGGIFRVEGARTGKREQRYVRDTNVLETVHHAERGLLTITDFMPVTGRLDDGPAEAPAEIVRILRAEGTVTVELEWSPRFDYGRAATSIVAAAGGFVATGGSEPLALAGVPAGARIEAGPAGPVVRHSFDLSDGVLALSTRWGEDETVVGLEPSMAALERTVDAWQGWVKKEDATGGRGWAGAWSEQVIRSELVLKLLTYAPTGAIVAAPTASLPEWIGGGRNWDYRYTWIRDSALAAQALFALGHRAEAEAFIAWSERAAREHGEAEWGLQIVYGVDGRTGLPESELPHLSGYRGSTPVRIGNGAVDQLQLDVYGELISAAYEVLRMGGELPRDILTFLPTVVEDALLHWREPDYGIWEVRDGPHHFVYSKAMVWMALDRALRMVREGMIEGDAGRWRVARDEIASYVLDHGYHPEAGAFTQRFGSPELDASSLLLPLMELVPFHDPRVQSTIDRTLEHLVERDLVYRYKADDGLADPEGAMGLCTFWLVDALALSGRMDEAYRVFDGMVGRANPAGLFSEQIDPDSGEFLGNFPQAFTHMGLINSAVYLAHMEGWDCPVADPIGSDAHRQSGREG